MAPGARKLETHAVTSGVHKKEKDITPGVCQLCTHAVALGVHKMETHYTDRTSTVHISSVHTLETQEAAPGVHKLETHEAVTGVNKLRSSHLSNPTDMFCDFYHLCHANCGVV